MKITAIFTLIVPTWLFVGCATRPVNEAPGKTETATAGWNGVASPTVAMIESPGKTEAVSAGAGSSLGFRKDLEGGNTKSLRTWQYFIGNTGTISGVDGGE